MSRCDFRKTSQLATSADSNAMLIPCIRGNKKAAPKIPERPNKNFEDYFIF